MTYWLCDEPADATTVNGWFEGQSNAPGFAFERSPWSWNFIAAGQGPPSGVFSVTITEAPEPGAIVLFGLAVLLVLIKKVGLAVFG